MKFFGNGKKSKVNKVSAAEIKAKLTANDKPKESNNKNRGLLKDVLQALYSRKVENKEQVQVSNIQAQELKPSNTFTGEDVGGVLKTPAQELPRNIETRRRGSSIVWEELKGLKEDLRTPAQAPSASNQQSQNEQTENQLNDVQQDQSQEKPDIEVLSDEILIAVIDNLEIDPNTQAELRDSIQRRGSNVTREQLEEFLNKDLGLELCELLDVSNNNSQCN